MPDLSVPNRQSPKSILVYLFKNIKGLIALGFYVLIGSRAFSNSWIVLVVAVLVGFSVFISPILKYYFFKFYVVDDELIIEQGVLNKERKAIPLERIQSVNINQNVAQRLLNVVAVDIETAGSKAKELEIPALERSFAQSFKDLLQEKATQVIDSNDALKNENFADQEDSSTQQPAIDVQDKRPLLQLSMVDLLKVGLTQNHLRSGGLALGIVFGFWYKIKDVVEYFYEEQLDLDYESVVAGATISLVVFVIISFCIIAVLVSMILVINKFWDYSIYKKGNYLEVNMGLLNRREVKIPINKIQILEFHSNPLRKMLGYQTARIYQAQSENNELNNITVPACTSDKMAQLQQIIFGKIPEVDQQPMHSIAWSHARLNLYIVSIFTVLPAAVFVYFEQYWLVAIPALVLLWTTYNAYKSGEHTRILKASELLTLHKGWLFPSIIITPVFKLQASEACRSIFLKRRAQSHFKFHTAGGSRGARYFNTSEVHRLKNDTNNQVIASDRYWM
ncbi:PH domain-containing protein [Nonlabens ponticola]|uniref:YdbS-like PH domain-containing protein n=1 Tax=Nonlabens ponticola TaxID=2496866 RepID=A0A3S9MZI3_9FLAO|nr:PH domain-containing protein [Nonlabens ponticola]AZQ44544.1 hypothetical protein EJ995_09910 [Nonlabens ponticola]